MSRGEGSPKFHSSESEPSPQTTAFSQLLKVKVWFYKIAKGPQSLPSPDQTSLGTFSTAFMGE